ncbi:MAG: nucleotidyltransferase family protein [Candidatus Brocadia sp.]|nr:nucleotidyltransferase family protein [Candidatus Brocadia sp.]
MRSEDKLLFACTRQNFLDVHQKAALDICGNEDVRWDVVHATAMQHGVASLVYSNLLKCPGANLGIPQDIIDKFKLCVANNIVRKNRRAEKLMEVLSFMKNKSIDVMLIKGVALDILVYDQPWYMISDDIDLILRKKKEDVSDTDKKEISVLLRHPVNIECEYFRHHDVDMNEVLPVNFQKIWDNTTRIKFRGYDVCVMSPEDLLMSACINCCRKRFFRLKSLCDVAETVRKYNNLNWDKLTRNAREHHCNSIVYAALLVTKMTLGCELPDGVLEKLTDSTIRATIIRSLARHFIQSVSLSSAFPFYKRNKLNAVVKKINVSLILPYATYRWYQLWRKMKYLWKTKPWG